MPLNELQTWILRELAKGGGTIDRLPTRPDVAAEAMEQAIGWLSSRQYALVVGPPNQNSYLGKDIDELHLLPAGAAHLRMHHL